ncbi:MucR family transcriptional regulator [Mesorhizobium sp. A556]
MTEENVDAGIDLIELTKHIVHAYVSNNLVPAVELPHTIVDVHAAVRGLQSGSATPHPKKNSFPLFRSEKR